MPAVSKFALKDQFKRYQVDFRFRKYVNVTLTFVTITVLLAFAIRPSAITLVTLISQINTYRRLNQDLEVKIQKINIARQNTEEFEKYKELVNKAIPSQPDEGNFIRNLNYAAARSGVIITGISFNINPDPVLDEVEFKISITGQYTNVSEFIANCHRLLRISIIESVNIVPDNDNPGYVVAELTGTTYVYHFKNQ